MAFSDVHSFIEWRLISRRYCLSSLPFVGPAFLYSIQMYLSERRDVLKPPDLKSSYHFEQNTWHRQGGAGTGLQAFLLFFGLW